MAIQRRGASLDDLGVAGLVFAALGVLTLVGGGLYWEALGALVLLASVAVTTVMVRGLALSPS